MKIHQKSTLCLSISAILLVGCQSGGGLPAGGQATPLPNNPVPPTTAKGESVRAQKPTLPLPEQNNQGTNTKPNQPTPNQNSEPSSQSTPALPPKDNQENGTMQPPSVPPVQSKGDGLVQPAKPTIPTEQSKGKSLTQPEKPIIPTEQEKGKGLVEDEKPALPFHKNGDGVTQPTKPAIPIEQKKGDGTTQPEKPILPSPPVDNGNGGLDQGEPVLPPPSPPAPKTVLTENVSIPALDNANAATDKHQAPKIAVMDTAFTNNKSIVGDIFGNRLSIRREYSGNAKGDQYDHGVLVSAIIANHNKNSDIWAYTTTSTYSDDEESHSMNVVNSGSFSHAYRNGARIFNLSFGNTREDEAPTNFNDVHKLTTYAAQDGIFAFAAGNEKKRWATNEAHDVLVNPEAKNGWLVVASTSNIHSGELASYSNWVGEHLKDHGITAQGDFMVDLNGYKRTASGTSYATPVVSAVAGNVWEKFPWYDNHLTVMNVLSTASDPKNFAKPTQGSDAKFGWGILNQARALKGMGRFDSRLLTERDDVANQLVKANVPLANYSKEQLTWSNDIAGDAGLLKVGDGALFLTGKNTYTGDTVVREGVLGVEGSLASGVKVESGGTLYAKNDKEAVSLAKNLTNNGSVHVYGKGLTVAGDYRADPASRLVIDVDKSHLAVDGELAFDGSRVVADIESVDSVPSSQPTTREIAKAGAITGYTGEYLIDVNDKPYIDLQNIEQKDNTLVATYQRNSTAKALQSANATATAVSTNTAQNVDKVLDEAANNANTLLNANAVSLVNMYSADLPEAVDGLSGELHTTVPTFFLNQSLDDNRRLMNRLSHHTTSGLWADFRHGETTKGQAGFASADFRQNTAYIGMDKAMGEHLLGVGVVWGEHDAQMAQAGKADIRQKGLFAYGKYRLGQPYLSANISHHRHQLDTQRDVLDKVSQASYRTRHTQAYGELGYDHAWQNTALTPFVGYQYQHLSRPSFTESAQFGVAGDKLSVDNHAWLAGVRLTHRLNDGLHAKAHFTQSHVPNPLSFDFKGNFKGSAQPITIIGQTQAKNSSYLGIGADYRLGNLAVNAGLDVDVADKDKNYTIVLGGKYLF